MMNGMGMWGPSWMLATSVLLMVLLLGAAVVVALIATRGRRGAAVAATGPAVAWGESTAVAAAKARYARGDIDHAELERILDAVLPGDDYPGGRAR